MLENNANEIHMDSKEDFNLLIKKLKSLYEIHGPYDLSPFFIKGKSWLFTFVKSLYKERFDDNERIVLYFDKDNYEYSGITCGELITELQYYITEIDISHFFVILISSDNRVANELTSLREDKNNKFIDQHPITYFSANNIPTMYLNNNIPLIYKNNDTLCVNLWCHLYINPMGNITPCCLTDHILGNIIDDSISDIRSNNKNKRIRHDMLSHQQPIECKHCYEIEKTSNNSPRLQVNQRWPDIYKTIIQNQSTAPLDISKMDIRISNICNLKCRICSGSCSSRIAKEQTTIIPTLNATQRNEAMNDIIQYIPNISSIYFAGGEPLIMDEHYQILDQLYKLKKLDILITYNTNLINLNYKNRNIVKMWKDMPNLTIGVSIDAIGKQAEYLRSGTNWTQLEKNFSLISTELPHADIQIDSTISIHNAFHLIKCHRKWIDDNFIDVNDLHVKILYAPSNLSISTLPKIYRDKLIKQINNHITFIRNVNGNVSEWSNVLTYLNKDNHHELYEFVNITKNLDMIRNESFTVAFPEYTQLNEHIKFISPHNNE